MKILYSLIAVLALTLLPPAAGADDALPGAGKTITPARCTWDTGFFHETLLRRGLEELGYEVKEPASMSNPIFYLAVSQGDVDYWPNGWIPNHKNQFPKNSEDTIGIVGYVIKAGGLQGYLVSKRDAEELNIVSLDDFKRAEVKERFDTDGDGKADLVACPPGWGCEMNIAHHFEVYGLDEHINPVKAQYNASMAAEMAKYRDGGPAFFYTWTPSWVPYKMKPGQDVVWINVPFVAPQGAEAEAVERMTVSGVKGAVSDPVKLGFVVSDIRVVANKQFLAENPAAKRFFEVFTLPLEDINAQNTRMFEGENKQTDIDRHVDEWIAAHKDTWDAWLAEATAAAE